jgi:hypothetical protein
MTEIERIRDQLRRAILGEAWHGPSVTETLSHLDETNAWVRMPPSGHNACELLLHVATWLEIAGERLEGRPVTPTPERDWPPAGESSPAAWTAAKDRLRGSYEDLDRALAALSDADLERGAPGKDYTLYFLAHGAVQHSLYHAGQLMLFGRLLEDGT